MIGNKGGSEISEIRVQPGSRSRGFTLGPTMAARSYMQENTFNLGDGRVKGRGTLPTALGGGPKATLGPGFQGLFQTFRKYWFLIICLFQILVLNHLFTLPGKTCPEELGPEPKGPVGNRRIVFELSSQASLFVSRNLSRKYV